MVQAPPTAKSKFDELSRTDEDETLCLWIYIYIYLFTTGWKLNRKFERKDFTETILKLCQDNLKALWDKLL